MNVCIISAEEPRDRQRFISEPLLLGSHNVTILKTKPLYILIFNLAALLFFKRLDLIIFIGVGIREVIAYSLLYCFNVPFIVRLGGNRLEDLDSLCKTQWSHGKYFSWSKFKVEKFFAKFFLKNSNLAIVVNEALKSKISTQLKTPNKIFVIPQFSEGPVFSRHYKCKTPINILTVTNFIFSNKAEGVIWLFHHLKNYANEKKRPIVFNIAGAGVHFPEVEQSLLPYMHDEFLTVKLLGFVTNVEHYYRTADVFIYRSFHDATPNVILQSKQFSLPILANDCDEFRNLIDNWESGLLYKNSLEFSIFLDRLIQDEGLRKRIGLRAGQDHNSIFSISASLQKIEAAIAEVFER